MHTALGGAAGGEVCPPESEDPTSGGLGGLAKVIHPPSFGHSGPFRQEQIQGLAAKLRKVVKLRARPYIGCATFLRKKSGT